MNIQKRENESLTVLLQELKESGIKLWIEDDTLHYKAPVGVINSGVLNVLKEKKRDIISYFKRFYHNTYMNNPIDSIQNKDYYSVSSSQKNLFLIQQYNKETIAYNMPFGFIFEGQLDILQLEKSVKEMIERHESFRTSFAVIDDKPVQIINNTIDFKIKYIEIDNDTAFENILDNFIRPFDLSKAPLLRMTLIKENKHKHILLLDIHHIISDGTSLAIFIEEFKKLYEGEKLQNRKIQYKDFAEWQNNYFASEIVKEQAKYWQGVFREKISVLKMPIDYKRKKIRTYHGNTIGFNIPHELTKKLREIAQKKI